MIKAAYWSIFDDLTAPPGLAAVDEALRRTVAFADRYEHLYPGRGRLPGQHVGRAHRALVVPREHWQRIRHTNLLERTYRETRRRTKVIGRLPGEASCVRLVWAPRQMQSIWGAQSIFITENGCAAADVVAEDGKWNDGFGNRFGLIYVDFDTLERQPKLSAAWFRTAARHNAVV